MKKGRAAIFDFHFLLILLTLLAACSDAGPPPSFSVRDSAGIQIVESLAPAWAEGAGWQVDPDPTLDLSGQDDDELFRVGRPRALPDGRIRDSSFKDPTGA